MKSSVDNKIEIYNKIKMENTASRKLSSFFKDQLINILLEVWTQ